MAHVRKLIREYVRARLVEIPGLEQNVCIDTEEIPKVPETPWAHASLGDEDVNQIGLGTITAGRKNERLMQLFVDLYCCDRTAPLEFAEELAAAVEAKIAIDPRMGGLTRNTSLRGYTIDHSTEGSPPLTRLRMQWLVTYSTNERDATVPA
jgi:hypothetical protein